MRPGRRIFVALVACSVWLGAMSFLPGLRVAAEDEHSVAADATRRSGS